MADFTFDSLANGTVVTFDVANDQLQFLDPSTSASSITLSQSVDGDEVIVTVAGKSVTLTPVFGVDTLSPANFSIAGGGEIRIGDLLTTDVQDNSANNIIGGNGSDYIAGLAGD